MLLETTKERWKKADELIEQGCTTVEIGRQIGVSHVAVLKYLKRSGKHEKWKENRKARLYSSRDELIAKGLSVEEIAERGGLAIDCVYGYIIKSGQREFYQEQRSKYLANLSPNELAKEKIAGVFPDEFERIVLEAVREYKTVSANELHQKIGEGRNFIADILRKHGISPKQSNWSKTRLIPLVEAEAEITLGAEPKGDYSGALRKAVLKCVLKDNPITIYQIQQKTGIGSELILNILQDEQAVTFIPRQTKRRPEWDELIAQGATLEETGKSTGVTRARIGQYINATGQHEFWEEQQKKRKVEKSEQKNALHQVRQELTSLLVARAYQRCDEGGWKYRRKALDYFYGGLKGKSERINKVGRAVTTPLEKLLTLFETYEMAERLEVKLSLEELEKRTGIIFDAISRILQSQGLEPMYGARERSTNLSSELNQAIDRAYGLEFTSSDVAYFLKLDKNPWVVSQHFFETRKSGAEKRNSKKWLFFAKHTPFGGGRQKGDALFYRTASQIYELDDMAKVERINFPDEEVAKLLEIRSECVEYARKNRGWIGDDILRLLKALYPDSETNKHYL